MEGAMSNFSGYLKSILYIIILLQIGPMFIIGIKKQYSDYFENKAKVGVVAIRGTLTNSGAYIKDLKTIFENNDTKAILLIIDSPGGAAGTSQAIFLEIKALKALYPDKYVVGLVENISASGGYYIASATDYIIATPAAFIGSIGSYIAHPCVKEFIEQYKLRYEVIKSGEYKASMDPFLELTEPQRELFQNLSDNVYQQFISDVASQRPHLPKDTKIWAEGKIFTGQQALKLGLIDELGYQSAAIRVLKENAHIEGSIDWVRPARKMNIFRALLFPEDDNENELSLTKLGQNLVSAVHESVFNINNNGVQL